VYYGGTGTVEIKRLFVRKDQISDELLRLQADPCKDKAKTIRAKKAEDTKWQFFCEQTDGGLYLPYNPRLQCIVDEVDGQKMMRVLIEMNVFSKPTIEEAIIKELLKIIDETGDETKIMIPEIMRIFEMMRSETVNEVYEDWRKKLIEPLISRFLDDTDRWEQSIKDNHETDLKEAEDRKNGELELIEYEYDKLIYQQKELCRKRLPKLHETRDRYTRAIRRLLKKRKDVIAAIKIKCIDICSEIKSIKMEKNEWIDPVNIEFNGIKTEFEYIKSFRESKLQEFKDENSTVFNPIEMQLKHDIAEKLDPEQVVYYFRELELMPQFMNHIAKLLIDPDLLLEDNISCFYQPIPTFSEEDLLRKAAKLFDKNIERVRNAFSRAFTEEMKKLFKTHVEDVEFELKGEVKKVDLTDKINNAMEETEKLLESELENKDEI
jgi:hypothetical protein